MFLEALSLQSQAESMQRQADSMQQQAKAAGKGSSCCKEGADQWHEAAAAGVCTLTICKLFAFEFSSRSHIGMLSQIFTPGSEEYNMAYNQLIDVNNDASG